MTRNKNSYTTGIFIIGILFFIFGFVTWLNATLIPYLKISCELTKSQSYWVTFAFYIAYFFMSLPSAWILRVTGYKNGMMLGLFIMAIGALLFIPAASTRTYELFLLGLFVMGTGLSILQTASNPYVIELGAPESAAKRVSIMGICNKFAGAISPLILGSVVLKDVDSLTERLTGMDAMTRAVELDILSSKAIVPYIIIMGALVLLGLFVRFSPLPQIDSLEEADVKKDDAYRSIFSYPHLWIGALTLFLYVGMEVIAVDTLINYANSLGISMDKAKVFPTYSMIMLIVGYIIGIICIPRVISQSRALEICAVLGVVAAGGLLLVPAGLSVWAVVLFSLANSLMWPAIFPLAIFKLGRHTKTGSAILIMAIAGGAILPLLYGYLADLPSIGGQLAYSVIGLPCYLFILYFAVAGHKVGLGKIS
ncbi:MAG: sugar MFS transporter [Odoribacteraceae bacterium]|jgi:glucose/galactose transporter|nr:sugar MFS transporter [Odoribacteraceae bacterium]